MAEIFKLPDKIRGMLDQWGYMLSGLNELQKVDAIRQRHPSLLKNKGFFRLLLRNITDGKTFPDTRRCEIFESEMLLYVHPNRHFSLRFAILAPGEYTVIHDHNAWGVIGAVSGIMEVVKYHRVDDGSGQDYARLQKYDHLNLTPGETDFTLPKNKGIHKTGNPTSNAMVTASIYGKPARRLYILGFDPEKNLAFRMYPPRLKKKLLARRALRFL